MKPPGLRARDLDVLRATFCRFPSIREVRVFGSRTTDTARRAADLDLALAAPDATPAQWADICEAIENAPLIYELDVVRLDTLVDARLRNKIARDGIVIYPEQGVG
jgi:predicted nucleotidyltransferase